ncbi:MAG: hypothetical protein EBT92_17580 [Planctomycetes bacterium]|nr:hypothetical protein [Planctomycetota bacterium]
MNDKRHREDGPAVEYTDGYKSWYLNGKQHREDGPAVESDNGSKEWWINDKRHREDGPAVEYTDGNKYWYLNGKLVTEQDVLNSSQTIEIDGVKYSLAQIKAALKKVA